MSVRRRTTIFLGFKKKKQKIDLWQLEKSLNIYYRERKYRIEAARKPEPGCLQLIVSKNGAKTLVVGRLDLPQGGVELIKDSLNDKIKYNCTGAVVIINSRFTGAAQKLARSEQVEIWDEKKIRKNLPNNPEQNLTGLQLPGAKDLEKTLREMSAALGINSENKE